MKRAPNIIVVALIEIGATVYVWYLALPSSDKTLLRMRVLAGGAYLARRVALKSGLLAIRLEQEYGKVSAHG